MAFHPIYSHKYFHISIYFIHQVIADFSKHVAQAIATLHIAPDALHTLVNKGAAEGVSLSMTERRYPATRASTHRPRAKSFVRSARRHSLTLSVRRCTLIYVGHR